MTREFSEFYAANFDRVAAQLYAYLGDQAEAQDLTQEAFCRAFARWAKIGQYDNSTAWVRQVALNLATSRLRHLRTAARYRARQRPEHTEGPNPDRVALNRALATLPPKQRLAVVLHHVGQVPTAEIAEQYGVAEGTVRSWLSRGRAQMAEHLTDHELTRKVAFRPAGSAAAAATVRRRTTVRRATIVAIVVALLLPLTILLVSRSVQPPVIEPTISPVPSVSVQTRPIVLPGVTFAYWPQVNFVDSRHGWLFYLWCDNVVIATPCQETMATTDDGGKTWRPVTLPNLPHRAIVVFFALNATTAVLQVTREAEVTPVNYWLTTDTGATFSFRPLSDPPKELLEAMHGHFYLRCPGTTGAQTGASKVDCPRQELAEAGTARVAVPPTLPAKPKLVNAANGRLWLYNGESGAPVLYSDDRAVSWHELPRPDSGTGKLQLLCFSPDRNKVWAVTEDRFYELVGDRWRERIKFRAEGIAPLLLDDGLWLVRHGSGMAYLGNGKLSPVAGLPAFDYTSTLPDGTIVGLSHADNHSVHLGIGSGVHREWVRIV